MKNLVIYYSKSGNNETVAKYISNKINCAYEEITEKNSNKIFKKNIEVFSKKEISIRELRSDLDKYDNVICVSPIWNGVVATPMSVFMKKYKKNIKKCYFLSICGGMYGINRKIKGNLINKLKSEPEVILELPLTELVGNKYKKKIYHLLKYQITKDDLKTLECKLENFIASIK